MLYSHLTEQTPEYLRYDSMKKCVKPLVDEVEHGPLRLYAKLCERLNLCPPFDSALQPSGQMQHPQMVSALHLCQKAPGLLHAWLSYSLTPEIPTSSVSDKEILYIFPVRTTAVLQTN